MVLVILDGWGHGVEKTGNPFYSAKLPTFDFLKEQYPNTLLQASGPAVGLSWGEPGNSEAGHMTIGAGRIIQQYPTRINEAIKDGSFGKNKIFDEIKNHLEKNNSRLHLAGLLTSGNVHASFHHLEALIKTLTSKEIRQIFLHLFTDGKDSGLKETPKLLEKLNQVIKSQEDVKVFSLIGRNFAMDRNHNWDNTQKTFDLLTQGAGAKTGNLENILKENYEKEFNDSSMPPIANEDAPEGTVKNNDAVFFFNFREDSMRQIIQPFSKKEFTFFPRELPGNLLVSTMTRYVEDPDVKVLFQAPEIKMGLSEILDANGKNQFHIAESEKYAHVTYFFNGLNDKSYKTETDFFIESEKNAEANLEMKSKEITQKVLEEIGRDFYDFILVNYANADILAHTGNFNAAAAGIEAVDRALSRVYSAVIERSGIMIITSDHGNVESMTYRGSGEKESRHNTNPVPFILISKEFEYKKGKPDSISGILADIAPTILDLMGIEKPPEITGESLLNLIR